MTEEEKDEFLMQLQKEQLKREGVREYKTRLFSRVKDTVIMAAALIGAVLGIINYFK